MACSKCCCGIDVMGKNICQVAGNIRHASGEVSYVCYNGDVMGKHSETELKKLIQGGETNTIKRRPLHGYIIHQRSTASIP